MSRILEMRRATRAVLEEDVKITKAEIGVAETKKTAASKFHKENPFPENATLVTLATVHVFLAESRHDLACKTLLTFDAEIALDESSEKHKELSAMYQREFTGCSLDEICEKIAKRTARSDFTIAKLTEDVAKLEVSRLESALR